MKQLKATREQIINDRLNGLTVKQICDKYGYSDKKHVQQVCRDYRNKNMIEFPKRVSKAEIERQRKEENKKAQQVKHDEVIRLAKNGCTYSEITEDVGLSQKAIYRILKDEGIKIRHDTSALDARNKAKQEQCVKRNEEIRSLRKQGISCREISTMYGVKPARVRVICKGIVHGNQYQQKGIEYQIQHACEKYLTGKPWEYVEGFTSIDGKSLFRCTYCGAISERSWVSMRHRTSVAECECILNQKREQKLRDLEYERQEKERIRLLNKLKNAEQLSIRFCQDCNNEIIQKGKRCPACADKRKRALQKKCWHNAEVRRRSKISSQMVDRDITLEKLAKRDHDTCWLCNTKVNWQDWIEKNGTIICGNQYPSQDHVIPLAKGGLHSWDNVKLAHRGCNSIKGDKIVEAV